MRVQPWLVAALLSLPPVGLQLCAQQAAQGTPNPAQTPPPSATPTEPGTHATQLAPASKAPAPVQRPDVRLDSKPHTDIDASVDSTVDISATPMDLGLGANREMDLGHDIDPVTAPGMIARSEAGNPRMVYYALPHRSGEQISSADSTILASRQADLVRAAAFHGFDLKQKGWLYQQGVCPAMQPEAGAAALPGGEAAPGGTPAADAGALLLHFVRHDDDRRVSAFTAVVPRAAGLPVRAISVVHRGVEENAEFLSAKTGGSAVNRALPPATLYSNLQPVQPWIATSACIAELGGAYPHIPNEPYLNEAILTAPPPTLGLGLNGERHMIFTDRVSDNQYVVWTEQVSRTGRMLGAQHEAVKIIPRPVTNPPVPVPRMIANIPQPPMKIMPEPPSPVTGDKQ